MRFAYLFSVLLLLVRCVPSYGSSPDNDAVVYACCDLGEFETAGGHIVFAQKISGGPTFISGFICNVTAGLHGWHVHEFGITVEDDDPCGSAGGHFNPFNMTHGAPDAEVRHVGDLGNFEANDFGVGFVATKDRQISLVGPSETSVLGRTLVIHGGEDDLGLGGDAGSLATGNAGSRVGCCVITMA